VSRSIIALPIGGAIRHNGSDDHSFGVPPDAQTVAMQATRYIDAGLGRTSTITDSSG
jgi:hypothetical protein